MGNFPFKSKFYELRYHCSQFCMVADHSLSALPMLRDPPCLPCCCRRPHLIVAILHFDFNFTFFAVCSISHWWLTAHCAMTVVLTTCCHCAMMSHNCLHVTYYCWSPPDALTVNVCCATAITRATAASTLILIFDFNFSFFAVCSICHWSLTAHCATTALWQLAATVPRCFCCRLLLIAIRWLLVITVALAVNSLCQCRHQDSHHCFYSRCCCQCTSVTCYC